MTEEIPDIQFDEDDIAASVCRDSFFEFVKEFWSTVIVAEPVFNWHIRYLCDELQTVAERVFAREPKEYDLVINVSPGSTKSTIASIMFPAWNWTRMKHARHICGSFTEELAHDLSVKSATVIKSEKYQRLFPEIVMSKEWDNKGHRENTAGGDRLSIGCGGDVVGRHADFIIVDDPLNPKGAKSAADIKVASAWMTDTLPFRKVDKSITVMILIMQRLHQADPTGDMLDKAEPGEVKHICLPAEIVKDEDGNVLYLEPPELIEFYVDGLFDPVRIPESFLVSVRRDPYNYAGQFLQHPVPAGGGDFEVDKMIMKPEPPNRRRFIRLVRSWDKAGTQDGGNWSAGSLLGEDEKGRFWVLDVIRGQWSAANREAMILQTAQIDGLKVEIELEIEGGSGGKESAENTVKMLAGYTVRAIHPTGDKQSRAYPLASQMGAGNVCCLVREWTKVFVDELRFFPNGRFDDQVDAVSAAFNRLAKKKIVIGALPIGMKRR